MLIPRIYQFESQNVEVVIIDGDPRFSSMDLCRILKNIIKEVDPVFREEIEPRKIEFQPQYLSFAESLCLILQYPYYKLVKFCRDVLLDIVRSDEWKYRYCDYWQCFIVYYYSQENGLTQELYHRRVFKRLIKEGRLTDLKGFSFAETKNSDPDFVLIKGDRKIVGEMRNHPFNEQNLRQLQDYLVEEYATEGIAIAPSLDCKLPGNIQLIKFQIVGYDMTERQLADEGTTLQYISDTL